MYKRQVIVWTSTPAELREKRSSILPRTRSPKTHRTSESWASRNPDGEDQMMFQKTAGGTSQFRGRPKHSEMSIHTAGAVKTASAERDVCCGSPRTRNSISLPVSEQYRRMIGGDWLDKFPSSSSAGQHKLSTAINGYHKPRALARQLKPDFVIYV